jgi:hypothetical protein
MSCGGIGGIPSPDEERKGLGEGCWMELRRTEGTEPDAAETEVEGEVGI